MQVVQSLGMAGEQMKSNNSRINELSGGDLADISDTINEAVGEDMAMSEIFIEELGAEGDAALDFGEATGSMVDDLIGNALGDFPNDTTAPPLVLPDIPAAVLPTPTISRNTAAPVATWGLGF